MSTDDPRIKRVLKRYPKGGEFSDSFVELTGISLDELQTMCHCSAEAFNVPRELDGEGLVRFGNRMGLSFDASQYDYFVHSYARREFCSSDRGVPKGLGIPCEDGPHAKIPLAKGTRWVSTRPKEGFENYVGLDDEDNQLNA